MTAETLGSHGDHSVVVTAVVACDKRIDARVPALASCDGEGLYDPYN